MRFERLDLNLLVALDALIEERSVSAAARRLHLSQPAISGALQRCREFFDDELLAQAGRQMVLTPRAEELARPIRDALMLIRTRITTPSNFDPETADRTFKIVTSDYGFAVLIAHVIADAARLAPRVQFEVLRLEPRTLELMERCEADLVITVESFALPDRPKLTLFDEEYAVICWSDSPHAKGVDAEAYRSAGHAISYFGTAQTQALSEMFLEQEGVDRRIEVRVPLFTMLPDAVVGTNRLATLQRRYAEKCARVMPITVLPTPFEMPSLHVIAQWHDLREKDAGLIWLLDLIRSCAAQL